MAIDMTTTAVLSIIIRARNEASAALRGAAADATGLQASLRGAGTAMLTAGAGLGLVTAGLATGMGALVKQATDFQTTLQHVQGNTTLTTADIRTMHDAILALGQQSGASFNELADAFMHTTNVGFTMAESIKIVRAGMESAIASGSDVGQVVNTLATAMREFNLPAAEAARVMDELHVAAASGNATLEQFVESAAKAHAMAAALHMPLEQIDAAFVAMTRHGFDVATASTYLTGMLAKMAGVSGQNLAALRALSGQTGINLVADFQNVGKQGYSLVKVITDLRTALEAVPQGARLSAEQIRTLGQEAMAQGSSQKDANAIMKAAGGAMGGTVAELFRLIPAMRGGLAAMVLTGQGFKDLTLATQNTSAAMRGAIIPAMGTASPTATAYAAALKTVGNQMAILERTVQGTAIVVGEAFLPQINRLLTTIGPLVKAFADWAKAHKEVIAQVLPLVTALAGLGATVLLVGGTIALFAAALTPAAITVGALIVAIAALTKAFTDHNTAVRAVAFVVGVAAGVLVGYRSAAAAVAVVSGVARTATLLWAAAQWVLNAALTANPIGIIIVALAAVAAGLIWAYQNVAPFRDAVNGLWTGVSGAAQSIAHAFRDIIGGAIGWALDRLNDFITLLGHIPGVHLAPIPRTLPPPPPALSGGPLSIGAPGAGTGGGPLPGASGVLGSTVGLQTPAPSGGAVPYGARAIIPGAADAWNKYMVPAAGTQATAALQDAIAQAARAGNPLAAGFQQQAAAQRAIAPATLGAGNQQPSAGSTQLLGGGGTTVNITVSVGTGAVQVQQGAGPQAETQTRDYGLKIGEKIADALAQFARAERAVISPPRPHAGGARG